MIIEVIRENKTPLDGVLMGHTITNNMIKADHFLNHIVDPNVMRYIGNQICNRFQNSNIDVILTAEASGIAPAIYVAEAFSLKFPALKIVFARKLNNDKPGYILTKVRSFTKQDTYVLGISNTSICKGNNVLIVDDFLASGEATRGLIRLCSKVCANVVGIGICVEKDWQCGRGNIIAEFRDFDYNSIYSVGRIVKLKDRYILE